MEYVCKHGYKVSQLTLGTAQFGLNYGIANQYGKPGEKEVEEILNKAFENGVNLLDTAFSYGDSERVIGKILNKSSYKANILVASKLPKLKNINNLQGLTKEIEQMLIKSLKNLQLENIPIFLLHDESYLTINDGYVIETLRREKEKGKIRLLGVSVYSPKAAEVALNNSEMQVIQVPFNVFDQRLNKINFFQRAAQKGKFILVRSVFLQGLILMIKEGGLPKKFSKYYPYFKKLINITNPHYLKVRDVAFKYALQKSQASVVLGVDSCQQLEENLQSLLDKKELDADIITLIEQEFSDMPLDLIDPRKWP